MPTIYVYLPDEAVDVWRPVSAERVADGVFVIDPSVEVPTDEQWEFRPGDRVYCERRKLDEGERFVAVRLAE